MELHVSCTPDGVKSYPHHHHNHWEIMLYLEGEGYLYTSHGNLPFHAGTIILVPPQTVHGSVSEQGFKNISIGGAFQNCLFFSEPIQIEDNADADGKTLALLLLKNRTKDSAYVTALANAYLSFLLNRIELGKPVNAVINEIISTISECFDDAQFSISRLLGAYPYTKDYLRQCFKAATGMHPTEFLTKCRIDRACFLIDIYRSSVSLSEIAERCGYLDYVYFSKQFKAHNGISALAYRRALQKKS